MTSRTRSKTSKVRERLRSPPIAIGSTNSWARCSWMPARRKLRVAMCPRDRRLTNNPCGRGCAAD